MNKYELRLMIVLSMNWSARDALAGAWTCRKSPDYGATVAVHVKTCMPGDCDVVCAETICVGDMIMVDVCPGCPSTCGSTRVCE